MLHVYVHVGFITFNVALDLGCGCNNQNRIFMRPSGRMVGEGEGGKGKERERGGEGSCEFVFKHDVF